MEDSRRKPHVRGCIIAQDKPYFCFGIRNLMSVLRTDVKGTETIARSSLSTKLGISNLGPSPRILV